MKKGEITEEKEIITIVVPKKLMDNFREFLARKYGEMRKGYISYEISQAISAWLATHTKAQNLSKINPQPRVFKVWEQVREYLKNKFGFTPQQVPKNVLNEAIALVRGNDERTIRKWLKEFVKYKVIKEINQNVWEIV